MGRPGITYLDVANAAQQLAARGTNPTIESIRVLLKSGSSSTIAQHLRTWKAKQDGVQRIAIDEKLPEELIAVMKGLWEKVLGQAEAQLTTIKQSTEQAINKFKQELSQHQQETQQIRQQCNELQQDVERLSQEKFALEQARTAQNIENATLHTQCDGFIQQLNEKQARVDELHRLNQQSQANLEHYRQASLEQRQREQQQAEERQHQLERALEQLRSEEKVLRQYHAMLQLQTEQYRSQAENFRTEAEKLSKDYDRLQSQWVEQNKNVLTLEKQHPILTQKLAILEASRAALLAENKQLSQEKWQLGQEKAVLTGQLKQMENIL